MVDSKLWRKRLYVYLLPGMSDGLATLVEVESTLRETRKNMFSGKPSLA